MEFEVNHTHTEPKRITAACTLGTQTRIHTSKTPTMQSLKYSGPRQRVGQLRAHDPRGSHARGRPASHATAPIRAAPGPATDHNGGRGPRPGEAAPGLAPGSGTWGPGRRGLVCVLPRPQAQRPGSASRTPLASQAEAKEARALPEGRVPQPKPRQANEPAPGASPPSGPIPEHTHGPPTPPSPPPGRPPVHKLPDLGRCRATPSRARGAPSPPTSSRTSPAPAAVLTRTWMRSGGRAQPQGRAGPG